MTPAGKKGVTTFRHRHQDRHLARVKVIGELLVEMHTTHTGKRGASEVRTWETYLEGC